MRYFVCVTLKDTCKLPPVQEERGLLPLRSGKMGRCYDGTGYKVAWLVLYSGLPSLNMQMSQVCPLRLPPPILHTGNVQIITRFSDGNRFCCLFTPRTPFAHLPTCPILQREVWQQLARSSCSYPWLCTETTWKEKWVVCEQLCRRVLLSK